MSPSIALAALLCVACLPLAAQAGSGEPGNAQATVTEGQTGPALPPYKAGDQAISLAAGAVFPLAIVGGPDANGLVAGAGFGFSYRYFLDQQWAIGGSIAGAFNGTIAGRSLFTAPLSADLSFWKALVPFEFFAEVGLGGYLTRLEDRGMLGPCAKLGAAALWKAGSGWGIGVKAEAWAFPEIHLGDYTALNRTGIFLVTGLFAAYHI